ncbi:MAG: sodium:proton antiporter [Phascolarctobacterium sp.]|nr:MnhB domain-containing protein [Phascolarctobacterium sp.]MUU17031.1 sodium:proton antiporter [Phascolarctobacterium sp.]
MIYGVYVLIFGEAGPGGGFQAGALLSIGVVLSRLIMGDHASFNISVKNSLVLAGVGTFIYAATGWLAMLNGGNFLDYSYLPFKAEHTNELHALGILFIEIGVTICVMMTIINILDAVVERGDENGSAK